METKLLTTAEAADRLGISEVRIRQLCQDGRLGRKIGRDWLFTAEEVESFRRQDRPTGRPAKED